MGASPHISHHVMFDVDGTLVESQEFDGICYTEAVFEVVGHHLSGEWTHYTHISDSGILRQHLRENGIHAGYERIEAEVKAVFSEKIRASLKRNPARQTPGASAFLSRLRERDNLTLSIATGGWRDTALLKLESAAIDINGLPLASADIHYSRTEIMKAAADSSLGRKAAACTYFGDAIWDRDACDRLGFNFVLVGSGVDHHQRIADFTDTQRALALIGL